MAAAYLTPADFGHLAIATGVVSIALAFSPVAFGEALVQRASLSPSHADAVFWLNAAFALLYCALLILAAPFVADWFGVPDVAWILPLLSLRVPFELVAAVPVSMITRAMQFRLLAIRTAIGSAVGTVVCLVLLLAGQGLLALVVSQVAVSATACAVAVWSCGWRPGLSARLSDIRDLARYGTFAAGQRMLGTLRVDHLVTGALGGAVLLGLLVFAQRIFQLLANIASGALSSVMHVVLSSMQANPRRRNAPSSSSPSRRRPSAFPSSPARRSSSTISCACFSPTSGPRPRLRHRYSASSASSPRSASCKEP